MIVVDIETGPIPDELLLTRVEEFQPPPHPGEFDQSTVKTGNLRDQAKILEKIQAARDAHNAAVKRYESEVAAARAAWWSDVKSRAALSPLTGRVLAVGYHSTDSKNTILDIDDDEAGMLGRFWGQYTKAKAAGRKIVGHNLLSFDVPFLMRRAWMLGYDVPAGVLDRGKWLDSNTFVDTMQLWGCGGREPVKLDVLARAFDVGRKPDGVDGGMFAELLKTDPGKAREYLANDLQMTAKVAERMGVV